MIAPNNHPAAPDDVRVGKIVEETNKPYDERLVRQLNRGINVCVRAMAIMMTVVIVLGVFDVAWTIYERLTAEPFMLLRIADFLAIFGAFMAVLIAMEIFVNITIYLREDVIHVNIVLATALMAVARKVVTLDFKETSPDYIYATAALLLTASVGYWLVVVRERANIIRASGEIDRE